MELFKAFCPICGLVVQIPSAVPFNDESTRFNKVGQAYLYHNRFDKPQQVCESNGVHLDRSEHERIKRSTGSVAGGGSGGNGWLFGFKPTLEVRSAIHVK